MSYRYYNMDHVEDAEAYAKRQGKPLSDLGRRAAVLLGNVFGGLYNVAGVEKIDWTSDRFIELKYRQGEMATTDFSALTELVFMAHDLALRVSVAPCTPTMLRVFISPRTRDGRETQRHATLEEALATHREFWPADRVEMPMQPSEEAKA